MRRMFGLFFEATWRRRLCFHPVIFFFLAAAAPPTVDGYFLGDIKAVVNGCEDHWALRDRISIPSLSQMTVCVNIRVVVPGPWVAFSYSSVRTPNPNLALEGDDKAIYGWLLQVQHQFPFKMSPMEWHRVCLRRDVRRNIFSLEVDHVMVAERTVIAQAIPPSGSLWLGCHQRNRSPGGAVGKVELYLFRMWADLGEHRSCEDGTVTGWDGDHWDVTSPNAKETDHSLPCDHKRLRRDANPSNATASSVDSVITSGAGSSRVFPAETGSSDITSPAAVRTTTPDKSPANQVALSTSVHPITALPAERSTTAGLFTSGTLVTCNISQLCSNKNAYYWIPMSVKSEQSNKTEQDLSNLVSEAFDCKNTSNEGGFGHFCKANGQLQVVEVTCRAKAAATESQTLCNVLLLLSHAVSACDLQHVLQRARGALQANITGNVERVGRTLCEDGLPSSGDFVRCTSTSSLDEICRSNRTSDISCSVLETNSVEAPQQTPNSCSGTVPRFCNCSAFCETERQLYAIKIKITSNMTVIHLRDLLLKSSILSVCKPNLQGENCSDIVTKHTGTHLECYGEINQTFPRFYSCMVVLEMSGPVNSCSLSKLVKFLIDKEEFITTDGSLSRMMVCGGAPDLSGPALLASNLKWSKADLLPSDVCQPGSTLIKCEANETLAVLLADSCPPVPQTTSPTQTNSLTSPTSVTHTTANAEQKQLTWSPNTSFTPPNNSTMHNLTSAAESSKNATVHSEISTNQTVFTTASLSETKNYNGSTTGPIHKQTTATTTSLVTSTKTTTKSPPSYAPVPSTSVLQSNETRTYGTTTSTKTTTELHPSYATVPSTSVLPSSETRTYSATSSTKTATKSPPSYVPSTSVFTSNETRTYGATSSTKTTTKSPPSYVPSTSLLPSNETRTYGTISSTKTTTESHPSYATVPSTSFLPSSETKTYDTSTVTPSTSRLAVSNVTTLNVFTSSGAKNNDGNTANNESTKSNIAANTTSNTSPPSLTNIQNVTSPTHPPVKLENVTTETNTLLTAVVSDYTKPYATPSNDQTTAYNARTPDRAEHHVATPSNNSTIIHYDTTPSKKYTTELKLTNPNNTTDNSTITSSNSHTTENINHTTDSNATAPGNNYTAEFNATKHNNQTAIQNATTPTNHYTTPSNSTTLTDNQATVDDSTIPSNNHTTLYATIKPNNNYTTIHNPTTPSNNHTTLFGTIKPNNNYTTIHNPTTPSNNNTTPSNPTSNNNTALYNATTLTEHQTTLDNPTTLGNNNTELYNTITPSNNHTTFYKTTTLTDNQTIVYNARTPSNIPKTPNNNTTFYNATTLADNQTVDNATTPSINHTTLFATIKPNNNYTTIHNPTTLSNNNTALYKATTLTEHQTTLDNPTTLSNNNTELYNTITPSNNHTTFYKTTTLTDNQTVDNATTPSINHTTLFATIKPNNNYTTIHNPTTLSNNNTALYKATTLTEHQTTLDNPTTLSNNNTELYNTITPSNNHTTFYKTTTLTDNQTVDNATTPSINHTTSSNPTTSSHNTMFYNATTLTDNQTTVDNSTLSSNNHTTYNATTPSNIPTTSNNNTTLYNATTLTDSKAKVINVTTTSNNNTMFYSTTTPSDNHTTVYNATTPSKNYTTPSNPTATSSNNTTFYNPTSNNNTTVYNATTPSNSPTTTSNNHTTFYNATTSNNNTTPANPSISNNNTTPANPSISNNNTTPSKPTTSNNNTTPANPSISNNNTTPSNPTTSNNNTTPSNPITSNNNTTPANPSISNNITTPSNPITSNNNTTPANPSISNNNTTPSKPTTSNNNITPSNASISNNNTTPSKPTTSNNNITPSNASISNNNTTPSKPTTSNNNITPSNASISNNNTTPANPSISNNNITPSKPTTTSNNNKAHYNATTPSYLMQHNTTTTSNIHTTVQTSSSRYLPESNATTTSSSYVADHQVTTRNNHMTAYEATQASINLTTLHKPNTSSNNYTTPSNPTTSNNYTTNRNMATIGSNFTNMYDTTPNHDFTTASPNNNTTSKVVAVHNTTKRDDSSSLYTTTKSPITYTTATEPPHKATTLSYMTTAPVVEPQQSTTSAKSTAVAAAMTKVTSTTHPHFTAESRTSVPDNRKPTDQTENQTTVSATPLTTVHKNDSSSTAVVTTIEENEPLSYNSATPVIAATATPSTTAHNPTNKIITTTEVSQKTTLPTIKTTTSTVARTGTTLTTTVKWLSEDMSKLNSSQVSKLVDDLEEILSGPTVSQSVGQNVLNVINNLINGDPEVLSGSTNSLIRMVDTLALKLEFAEDVGILSSDSLVLAVRKVDWTDFLETSVEIFDIDDVQLQHVRRVKRSAPALGSVGLPSSVTSGLSPEEKQQASRVQFTFYKNNFLFKDSSLDNQTAVSPVLGSSVANLSISNLQENVTFTINHSNLTQNNVTSCVFWNFTKKNGLGGWDDTGCSVVSATPEYTTCSCNHLTSFAILLDLSREGISDPQQAKILTFITYIGCGISAVFLAVTLITYMLFEKLLRDIPAKILVQLCLSLLLLNLVFLLDGWLSNYENVNLCISTAFFLHYFLLSSFTWAGLEALHMYLSIVRVFAPYLSKYMLKFSLMGWGIPLFVVVVIVAVDKNNYGLVPNGKYEDGTSDKFCWLRNDIAFYVGVVAYFLLIFVLCLAVFIVVMVQLARIKKQNPHNQSPNRSTMTDIRSIIGLVLLLGLTWGFALFAWGEARLAFLYMFTICNSLLGLFVFIFHCVVKENVRRMWRTFLCCGNWRLSENSECSRTATHNKLSVVATATTSANQHSNLSSSFGSNVTSSSSSVFWDSGISDRSSSDIVLNEARRQSQSLQGEP